MRNYFFLFILVFYVSCQDPDPDLSSSMAGQYYLTETSADSVLNTVWKVSVKDRKHVNLAIELETVHKNHALPSSREAILIENIRVSRRRNILDFGNEFVRKGAKYHIVGKATLSGEVITCDAIVSDSKGREEHWAQVLTRKR